MVADGNFLPITHTGSAVISSSSGILPLRDVLVCLAIATSLLSVFKVTTNYPCFFKFNCDGVIVKDKVTKGRIILGRNSEGLYALSDDKPAVFLSIRQQAASDVVWHRRLGHPNDQALHHLSSINAIRINKRTNQVRESCSLGKSARLPFSLSEFVATKPLQRIHCDLWGPFPTVSVKGFRYYVILIDNWSRFSWIYPLKLKSDFFSVFLSFQKLVENQFNTKIGTFQSDGEGEFTSTQFLAHLQDSGIQHYMSCPHTPQQNGLAERKHRYVTELGLSMMFQSKMPSKYWVEAFFTANYLTNLLPTTTLASKESPYQKLFGSPPVYASLRKFGCACFPTLRDYADNKFDPKSLKCVFMGYSAKLKGYRCLYPPTGRVYISRHVIFDENRFPFQDEYLSQHSPATTSLSKAWLQSFVPSVTPTTIPVVAPVVDLPVSPPAPSTEPPNLVLFERDQEPSVDNEAYQDIQQNQTTTSEGPCTGRTPCLDHDAIGDSVIPSASRTVSSAGQSSLLAINRGITTTCSGHQMITRSKSGIQKSNQHYALHTQKVTFPKQRTVTEALKHPGWNGAMTEGYDTCGITRTWSLVPYSPGMNVLGSKWIFTPKIKADGSLDRLKARIVAQGFDQEEGIDYLERYSL
ncbi:unnamed protein product [Microthlaspi erraticum]|uniref:Integrase catalytic domain-containing protein n=1 Tax=Microthlaspi erraticum TaxID=1685480 RepID=A0A6D2L5Y3_9BRAS|nr:unnamed protein product [Microthlaspi erraticum]